MSDSSTDKDAFEELVIAECGSELWLPEDMPKIKSAFKKWFEQLREQGQVIEVNEFIEKRIKELSL